MPLWPGDPAGGAFYEVRGHPQITEIVLPERGFWILIRDPENEASGVLPVGTPWAWRDVPSAMPKRICRTNGNLQAGSPAQLGS